MAQKNVTTRSGRWTQSSRKASRVGRNYSRRKVTLHLSMNTETEEAGVQSSKFKIREEHLPCLAYKRVVGSAENHLARCLRSPRLRRISQPQFCCSTQIQNSVCESQQTSRRTGAPPSYVGKTSAR